MRDSTIFSNRANRSSSAESADSARAGHGFGPGFGSGAEAALKANDPCGIRGAGGAASADGAAGRVGRARTAGVCGAGATVACELTALELRVFIFGPEPMAAGLGVADRTASPEAASPASG